MNVMVIVKAYKGSEAGKGRSTELLTAIDQYNEELVKACIMPASRDSTSIPKGSSAVLWIKSQSHRRGGR